jgi:hypothetical protein
MVVLTQPARHRRAFELGHRVGRRFRASDPDAEGRRFSFPADRNVFTEAARFSSTVCRTNGKRFAEHGGRSPSGTEKPRDLQGL